MKSTSTAHEHEQHGYASMPRSESTGGHAHHGTSAERHDDTGGHDRHAGHSVEMFRDRFWITLLLSVPTVVWSDMIQMWFRFTTPAFPGSAYIPAVFGTAVYLYGGWVFLEGGARELLTGRWFRTCGGPLVTTSLRFRWQPVSSPRKAYCYRPHLPRS